MTEQPVHPTQYEHPGAQPYAQPTEPYSYGADPRAYTVAALPEVAQNQAAILWEENRELRAEVERLKRGDWTPEEVHDLCHNLHGKVSAEEFAAGCAAEQRKLYGCAPDADRIRELEAERDLLAAQVAVLKADNARFAQENIELEERISLCSGSCRA